MRARVRACHWISGGGVGMSTSIVILHRKPNPTWCCFVVSLKLFVDGCDGMLLWLFCCCCCCSVGLFSPGTGHSSDVRSRGDFVRKQISHSRFMPDSNQESGSLQCTIQTSLLLEHPIVMKCYTVIFSRRVSSHFICSPNPN